MLSRSSLVCLLTLALAPVSARAQDVAPETLLQSNALFAQGKRELDAGQITQACASFDESYRLLPRGGTLLNLGLCHEREGKSAEAWRDLRTALAIAQREGREDRVPLAREHIAGLEAQLTFAALALPHDVDPSLVALRLDGSAVLREEWNGVPLAPGEHVLTAEAVGFESWSTKIHVGTAPARLLVSIGPLIPSPSQASSPAVVQTLPYTPATPYVSQAPMLNFQRETPEARDLRLAEQRLALEGWFVELGIGVTASEERDRFVSTLRNFDYEEASKSRATIDATAGWMLTRNLGFVFHYDRLERRRYATMDRNFYGTASPGDGQRYVYSWHTQSVMAGLRLRQPLASHWLVLFADVSAGLAFTKSLLEYEIAAGASFLPERDDSRDRSFALRAMAGFDFGFTRHFGAFLGAGYMWAPTLGNVIGETHDAGGPVFLTGLRLNSVKGWW